MRGVRAMVAAAVLAAAMGVPSGFGRSSGPAVKAKDKGREAAAQAKRDRRAARNLKNIKVKE